MQTHPAITRNPDPYKCFTIPELRLATGYGERTLRDAVKRGKLRAYRLTPHGTYRVRWVDFESWLRALAVQLPGDPAAEQHADEVVKSVRARAGRDPRIA